MNEGLAQKRLKKIATLKEELTSWQQVVVKQDMRIARLEATLSALLMCLNKQPRFGRFNMAVLNNELERILKAQRPKENSQDHGHAVGR